MCVSRYLWPGWAVGDSICWMAPGAGAGVGKNWSATHTASQLHPEGLQLLSQGIQMLHDFWVLFLCLGHYFHQVKLDHF